MAEVEVEVHRDAKNLSKPNVDPKLSQQKRREYLLEWQKTRRDELVDKLRTLDDSGASESEGEDVVDFLDEVNFKGKGRAAAKEAAILPAIVEVTTEPTITLNEGSVGGRGRGRGASHASAADIVKSAVDPAFTASPGRGRGRARPRPHPRVYNYTATSLADDDCNWREKKPEVMEISKPEVAKAPTSSVGDKTKNRRFRRKRPAPYGLMLSEWLVDIPEDFETDWVGVLCPVGKRCVVVACRGRTRVYTRRNDYMGQFSSCLPGGSNAHENNLSGNGRRGLTILDCLWSDKSQTFYVLDLICWNSYSVNNCPTDFRHYFLTSKFSEKPELLESSARNVVPFQPLPFFPVSDLGNFMLTGCPSFPDEIDGVIFYHNDVFYLPHVTPLVLWVHLSDMETVLGIAVNPDLLSRERVRHEKARYYLQKPNYSKKNASASSSGISSEESAATIDDEPCDENGVPLG